MTFLKDIIAKVRDTITDNKTWQAEKDGVLKQLEDAAATAGQMKDSFEKQIGELKTTHDTTVTGLNDQIKTLRAEVDAEKKSVEGKAEIKAQAIAGSIGVTNEAQLPKVINEVLTVENVGEKMAKDKTLFSKNKETILKLAGISQDRWDRAR